MPSKREFVITDGKKFIRQDFSGKYSQVNVLSMADTYNSQKAATNIMLNSISKSLSRRYYVGEIVDGKVIQCNSPRCPKTVKACGEQVYHFENDFRNMKWCTNFIGLEGLFEDAMKRGRELSQEISDIDAQIIDLEHYIEFTSLNARDGYKIYRKLKELFCKRRFLKNEQKVVSVINKNHSASQQISSIIKAINGCDNSEYKPRILIDLFEKGIDVLKWEKQERTDL